MSSKMNEESFRRLCGEHALWLKELPDCIESRWLLQLLEQAPTLCYPPTVQTEPSEIEKPVQDVRELFEKTWWYKLHRLPNGEYEDKGVEYQWDRWQLAFQAGYNAALTASGATGEKK